MAGGEADFSCEDYIRQSDSNRGKLERQLRPPQLPKWPPVCPECGSAKVWKDGKRYTNSVEIQRYICRSCGFRFSESMAKLQVELDVPGQVLEGAQTDDHLPDYVVSESNPSLKEPVYDLPLLGREDVAPHKGTAVEQSLNTLRPNFTRRIGAREGRAKNSATAKKAVRRVRSVTAAKPKTQKQAAGDISAKNTKELTFAFAWQMKTQGLRPSTIEGRVSILKTLINRRVDIYNPKSVKEYLASVDNSDGRKENIVQAYTCLLKMLGGTWEPPSYKRIPKIPYVPLEKPIDQLIAYCPNKYRPFLQLLKETGMRSGEAWHLEWKDIDIPRKSVRITPEKGGNPRILPISDKLIAMLSLLPRNGVYVFRKGLLKHFAEGFRRHRKKISMRLGEPDMMRITFKTLRHFKGTMEYHKTKDILHVKYVLGHKNIKNTLVYTHLVGFKDDEYIAKIAKSDEEFNQLIEAGFEYVGPTPEGHSGFRKRK